MQKVFINNIGDFNLRDVMESVDTSQGMSIEFETPLRMDWRAIEMMGREIYSKKMKVSSIFAPVFGDSVTTNGSHTIKEIQMHPFAKRKILDLVNELIKVRKFEGSLEKFAKLSKKKYEIFVEECAQSHILRDYTPIRHGDGKKKEWVSLIKNDDFELHELMEKLKCALLDEKSVLKAINTNSPIVSAKISITDEQVKKICEIIGTSKNVEKPDEKTVNFYFG